MIQPRPYLAEAKRLFEARRLNDQLFGSRYFSDPRWDILLYLFFATAERGVTLAEVARAGAATETTIWRHVHTLIDEGDVLPGSVEGDLRQRSLQLSENCSNKITGVLDRMREALGVGS